MGKLDSRIVHVLVMTAVSGCADAIGFLALGQVLVAAMTGNTVFLGLAIVHADGLEPMSYVIALGGFMLGAATGALGLRNRRLETGVNLTVSRVLLMQWTALVLFGVIATVAAATNPPHLPHASALGTATAAKIFVHGTIGMIGTPTSAFSSVGGEGVKLLLTLLLTFGMGVQGALARRVGVNGIPTTVITSLTTGLMESLVWNACGPVTPTGTGSDAASGPVGPSGSTIKPQPGPHTSPATIAVWITDIVFYGLGAATCGALVLHWHLYAIWLPVVLISALVIYSFASQLRAKPQLTQMSNVRS
ncbi:YoaK family protein [Alicyclobacillus sp. ALC3]|uniref:YoaK family protein n=1 Tax=Alicyclobacillus sp. ALC3 TaxID=2796143 RepID=UPI002379B9D2|nr:YoaK family protein [Alicyclobacillus sp. ALC3]WDL95379.1 DUF1275 domain-containing protein [Alicyclobacillus sp. ALC3]